MKFVIRFICISVFIACISLGIGFFYLSHWADKGYPITQQKPLVLAPGTSLKAFALELQDQKAIDNALFFYLWVKRLGNYQHFQAGHYLFKGSMSPNQIINAAVRGDTYQVPFLTLVIPEGFTLEQIIERLHANGLGDIDTLRALVHNHDFIASFNINARSLEGYLYPATYNFFEKMPTGAEALSQMVKKFFSMLPAGYLDALKEHNLTLDQAVTMASLIELESFYEDEMPKISEVIWNRLKAHIPLAIDAAIIYGIKGYQGDLKTQHLRDTKNPYNTRVHLGLPPSAIGSPSQNSLKAVIAPSSEGYYYYVLLSDNSKRHHFSKTLAEHGQYVRQLLKKQKK